MERRSDLFNLYDVTVAWENRKELKVFLIALRVKQNEKIATEAPQSKNNMEILNKQPFTKICRLMEVLSKQ